MRVRGPGAIIGRLHERQGAAGARWPTRNGSQSGMTPEINAYSRRWHETFHRTYDAAQTDREVGFLARWLRPGRVLDVCCGYGRHMTGLGARGYDVLGVDRERDVVADARRRGLDVRQLDAREIGELPGTFDGVICMWSSFGLFDESGNSRLLAAMASKVRRGGRLVLDLPDRQFFEAHLGSRVLRPGVSELKTLEGRRLRIALDYGAGTGDVFEWEAFTATELAVAGAQHGLTTVLACAGFDETQVPSGVVPRMQLVMERREAT